MPLQRLRREGPELVERGPGQIALRQFKMKDQLTFIPLERRAYTSCALEYGRHKKRARIVPGGDFSSYRPFLFLPAQLVRAVYAQRPGGVRWENTVNISV